MTTEKIKEIGKKIKKTQSKKPTKVGTKGLLSAISSENIKKLIWGTLIFAMGYSTHYMSGIKISSGDTNDDSLNKKNTTEYVSIEKDSIKNTVFDDGKYYISAPTQGLIDTLIVALDELSLINPLTAGFVEDMKAMHQKFIIIPDSLMDKNTGAFYSSGAIFIRDNHVRKFNPLKKQINEKITKFDNISILIGKYDNSYNKYLYNIILHEGRHAMQARAGILLLLNNFRLSGNLLDFMASKFFIEGDAEAYANLCLNDKNNISDLDYSFNTGDWLEIDIATYDYFDKAIDEGKNIKHSISPELLSDTVFWKHNKSKHENMLEFDSLFFKIPIPISYNTGTISYEFLNNHIIPEDARGQSNGFDTIASYIPILNMFKNPEHWFGEDDLELGKKMIADFRANPESFRKFLEDNLKKQSPNLYNDSSIVDIVNQKKSRE